MSEARYADVERAFGAPETAELALKLDEQQRQELRNFWLGRAHGELTTALSFEFMLEDLRALGAPRSLLELAESAIADEHRHVDWCLRFARLLSDEPCHAELGGTRPVTFDGASEHDNRLLRSVFGGCFSETVAVQVLLASQAGLTLDSARRLNRQHVAEEVRHARLGWGLVAWPELGARDRSMLAAFVPAMTSLTRALWTAPDRAADPQLEALGYLSVQLIEGAMTQAFDEVILPGLEHNGIRGA